MRPSLNRALQVRAADRLRAGLAREEHSGLPSVDGLTEADQRELCEVGGGRLGAIAIRVDGLWLEPAAPPEPQPTAGTQAQMIRAAARLLDPLVRRTDVLGCLGGNTLVVLAPGLDSVGGRRLADRLREALASQRVEIAGQGLELRVNVGAAFRCAASPSGWTTRALTTEAEQHALQSIPA